MADVYVVCRRYGLECHRKMTDSSPRAATEGGLDIQVEMFDLPDESGGRDHIAAAPTLEKAHRAGGEQMLGADRDREGVVSRRRPALLAFRRLSVALALADATAIVAALLALHYVASTSTGFQGALALALVVAPLEWIVVFHAFGLYRIEHLSAWEEFRGIVSATTVGVGLVMLSTFWWQASFSRLGLAWTWLFALSFELMIRRTFRWWIRHLKRDGTLALRTLLVGTNEEAMRLARVLAPSVRGFVPIGCVATSDASDPDGGLPRLGRLDALADIIRQERAECVFVASSAVSPKDMVDISRACRQAEVEMRVSANLPDILTSRLSIQPIEEVMALYLKPVRFTRMQATLKRCFDLMVAPVTLLVLLPVMAVIAVAVRSTSPGPVIFRQARMTKNGRVFTILKFRTMVSDAEQASDTKMVDLTEPFVVSDAEQASETKMVDLTEPFFKLRDDPRLTRIGYVLRKFSLDELPQLWNVVRGDMSLVGPRPLRIEQIEADRELLEPRHEVKAGMTGWWQINGRSDLDLEDAVRLDLFYIDNWSLSLDLYILLKTAGVILRGKGAY
jgi:exopolysaccharide biosynthesis polyprenyl glycosylphosphotransferase